MDKYLVLLFIAEVGFISLFFAIFFSAYEVPCSIQSSHLVNSYSSSKGFLYLNKFVTSEHKTCQLFSPIEPLQDKEYLCLYFPLLETCSYTDLRDLEISILAIIVLIGFTGIAFLLLIDSCKKADKHDLIPLNQKSLDIILEQNAKSLDIILNQNRKSLDRILKQIKDTSKDLKYHKNKNQEKLTESLKKIEKSIESLDNSPEF